MEEAPFRASDAVAINHDIEMPENNPHTLEGENHSTGQKFGNINWKVTEKIV